MALAVKALLLLDSVLFFISRFIFCHLNVQYLYFPIKRMTGWEGGGGRRKEDNKKRKMI
jgi:hypothetical protein